jgi:transcriptional regulator with XRE-family HTH domain
MANIDKDPAKGLNAAVAAELRAERVAQEVTFDDLVKRVSLSRNTTWRLLNAERLITIEALVEVAGALGVSVLEIIERAEKRLARDVPPPPPKSPSPSDGVAP